MQSSTAHGLQFFCILYKDIFVICSSLEGLFSYRTSESVANKPFVPGSWKTIMLVLLIVEDSIVGVCSNWLPF